MKVLAVIPARKGSKGIPNKNVRVINGKPLIWYSIQNAITSNYISDVVVTTDSNEIERYCKKIKGVSVRRRKAELCGDNITLDPVIYDAIPHNTLYDYIVTMQPTSPTLDVRTLDKAIEFAIDNKYDTVISVINSPHLSWKLDGDHVYPNYIERLNRQQLPAHYLETGAFLISRSTCVNKNSRIGKNVCVFEISKEESYDIDTFEDLNNCKRLINGCNVGIYYEKPDQRDCVLNIADRLMSYPEIICGREGDPTSNLGDSTYMTFAGNITDTFQRLKDGKLSSLVIVCDGTDNYFSICDDITEYSNIFVIRKEGNEYTYCSPKLKGILYGAMLFDFLEIALNMGSSQFKTFQKILDRIRK